MDYFRRDLFPITQDPEPKHKHKSRFNIQPPSEKNYKLFKSYFKVHQIRWMSIRMLGFFDFIKKHSSLKTKNMKKIDLLKDFPIIVLASFSFLLFSWSIIFASIFLILSFYLKVHKVVFVYWYFAFVFMLAGFGNYFLYIYGFNSDYADPYYIISFLIVCVSFSISYLKQFIRELKIFCYLSVRNNSKEYFGYFRYVVFFIYCMILVSATPWVLWRAEGYDQFIVRALYPSLIIFPFMSFLHIGCLIFTISFSRMRSKLAVSINV